MKTYILYNDLSYWYMGEKQNPDDIEVSGPPPDDGLAWFWDVGTGQWVSLA